MMYLLLDYIRAIKVSFLILIDGFFCIRILTGNITDISIILYEIQMKRTTYKICFRKKYQE